MRPIFSSVLRSPSLSLLLASLSVSAAGCQSPSRGNSGVTSGDQQDIETEADSSKETTADTTTSSADTSSEDGGSSEQTSADSSTATVEDESTVDFPLFDLEAFPDFEIETGGCAKVDFLFIVDSSASMEDEQVHLVNSFPGFMKGLDEQIDAEDFQIMVIDSGVSTASSCDKDGACTCRGSFGSSGSEACCPVACEDPEAKTCASKDCSEFSDKCDYSFGSGRQVDDKGTDCGIADGRRYILNAQPDRDDAFSCAASAGIEGDFNERMMEGMLAALSPELNGSGGCNEGFLREDAILVVTFITDEEEKGAAQGSAGDPNSWYNDLLALKGGDKDAIVMVGIYGDVGQPGAICTKLGENNDQTTGAEASPRLREFVEKFGDLGVSGTVCAEDYSETFNEAISKISTACSNWDPK